MILIWNNIFRYKWVIYFSQIETENLGPRKKIEGQIKAFAKEGIQLELVEAPFCREGFFRKNFLIRQIVCRLPYTYVYSKHKYLDKYKDADIYYIRFIAGDRQFVHFLKELRENNPKVKIIMEFADYPTTWYMTTSKIYTCLYLPIILKDLLARRYYKKYVDRITMLKGETEAYGIPVIRFTNGIDMDAIPPRRIEDENADVIKIIAVAAMCNFHGYDRLIEGVHQYYETGETRKVEIHFVGGKNAPGNELVKYKELVEKYGLTEYATFYGEKQGAELNAIYDQCNLAVASLGMYRIGYTTANSLKIREYMAKGLPIITGCPIDVLDNDTYKYCLEFSNDSSIIDINKIVDFYDHIYGEETLNEVNIKIRHYAMEVCDMQSAMKNVINYMKEG